MAGEILKDIKNANGGAGGEDKDDLIVKKEKEKTEEEERSNGINEKQEEKQGMDSPNSFVQTYYTVVLVKTAHLYRKTEQFNNFTTISLKFFKHHTSEKLPQFNKISQKIDNRFGDSRSRNIKIHPRTY
jgi:hypothetical protein